MSMRKRRYVVVPDPSFPGRASVECWTGGDLAGVTIVEFGSLASVAVHACGFTAGECESLHVAVNAAAQSFADAMNEAERVSRAPPPEPAPETVPFEPYRKIARDPIPVFGKRKGRKKAKDGASSEDGDVLGP